MEFSYVCTTGLCASKAFIRHLLQAFSMETRDVRGQVAKTRKNDLILQAFSTYKQKYKQSQALKHISNEIQILVFMFTCTCYVHTHTHRIHTLQVATVA